MGARICIFITSSGKWVLSTVSGFDAATGKHQLRCDGAATATSLLLRDARWLRASLFGDAFPTAQIALDEAESDEDEADDILEGEPAATGSEQACPHPRPRSCTCPPSPSPCTLSLGPARTRGLPCPSAPSR